MAAPSLHLLDVATGEKVQATRSVLMERVEVLERELADAERDLRLKRREITRLKAEKQRERDSFEQKQLVMDLFDFWRVRCKKPKSKLTPDRFDALRNALNWGYSAREIGLAIAGAAYDPFITRSKSGKEVKHQDLELICRTGKSLENFAERAPRNQKSPQAASA